MFSYITAFNNNKCFTFPQHYRSTEQILRSSLLGRNGLSKLVKNRLLHQHSLTSNILRILKRPQPLLFSLITKFTLRIARKRIVKAPKIINKLKFN